MSEVDIKVVLHLDVERCSDADLQKLIISALPFLSSINPLLRQYAHQVVVQLVSALVQRGEYKEPYKFEVVEMSHAGGSEFQEFEDKLRADINSMLLERLEKGQS